MSTVKAVLLAALVGQMACVCYPQDLDVKIHVETINGRVPLALAHLYGQTFTGPITNMNPYELVSLEIQNKLPTSRTVQVKLDLPGLGAASIQKVELGPHAKLVMRGSPILNPKLISEVVDERVAKLKVEVVEGQMVAYSDTINVTLTGKDDVPMHDGFKPLYYWLVTRVQPKSKLVNQVLSEAAQRMGLKWQRGIVGYAGRSDVRQMQADLGKIYDTMQEMGFAFVSTPVSFEKGYQRIKTPSEAIRNKNGNCIDGSLVFASCISALGYNPLLVLIPGHAFVVATIPGDKYDASRASRLDLHSLRILDNKPALPKSPYSASIAIETTILQRRPWSNLWMTPSFGDSVRTGFAELQKFMHPDKIKFVVLLDVEAWRSCGLLPSPDDQ